MDMSFSLADAAPLSAPPPTPFDFAGLLATLDADRRNAGEPAADTAVTPGQPSIACLITVLLGRAGWADAGRALRNRFSPVVRPTARAA